VRKLLTADLIDLSPYFESRVKKQLNLLAARNPGGDVEHHRDAEPQQVDNVRADRGTKSARVLAKIIEGLNLRFEAHQPLVLADWHGGMFGREFTRK
jgi:hypothetical protein